MSLTVVIITGSIAAPNVVGLTSSLKSIYPQEVAVIITPGGRRFVADDVVRITGAADYVFTDDTPESGRLPSHVALAQTAEPVIIYPASAGFIGRVAGGLATDLASNFLLCASAATRFLFPSMNEAMWNNPILQRNLTTLATAGFIVYPSVAGMAPLPAVAIEYLRHPPV